MPTPTYDLIASNVLTSSASSVTFSSIPSTYRDLVVVFEGRSATSVPGLRIRLNGDTTNYSAVIAQGDGSSTSSGTYTALDSGSVALQSYTRTFTSIIQIMDYSATDKHKTLLYRANQTYEPDYNSFLGALMGAGRWASTSAVNSVTLVLTNGGNFASGTNAYLYGIVS